LIAGDIVLFKGTSFISRIIRFISKGEYTHVALAINSEEIIEADRFIKTRVRKLSEGESVILMRSSITEEQGQGIANYALTLVDNEYDYLSVFIWFIRLLFSSHIYGIFNNANRLYCSEVVDRSYQHEGIDLIIDRETGDVLPSEFILSPRLNFVEGE
jgi:uncharacterized protein YycO